MEKLCIDVRGFSEEKKKRVQDAFFALGIKWSYGDDYSLLDKIKYGNVRFEGGTSKHLLYGAEEVSPAQKPYEVTYSELMGKAGLAIDDPDVESITLQKGDYTTREEIIAYTKREGLSVREAYERICEALVNGGAKVPKELNSCITQEKKYLGWDIRHSFIYSQDFRRTDENIFTRHLTPEQILSAVNTKEVNVEKVKFVEGGLEFISQLDLHETIKSYLSQLENTQDTKAREILVAHIGKLLHLEFCLLMGEDDE